MTNQILYLGPDDFRGLIGMPEHPKDHINFKSGMDQYSEPLETNGFWQKHLRDYEKQVESLKANAPKIHLDDLPTYPKPHIDGWIIPKNLKPGDKFPLPEGYEFKTEIGECCGHPCEEYSEVCQYSGCSWEGKKFLRIVKVEVKSEVKEEMPPSLKFKFDPLAELTYEQWEKMSKIKRPENTKDNKAWAGAWLEGEMSGYAQCMIQKVLSKPEPEESQTKLLEELLRMSLRSDERILDYFIIQRKK